MTLKKRDIGLLFLGVLGLFFVLYYFIVITPALSRQHTLEDLAVKKEAELQEMLTLQQQRAAFQQTRREAENILKQRGKDFTLLTYLERISREVGIDSKIQYIKPVTFPEKEGPMQATGIEMRFNKLDIKELTGFLHRVEKSKNLLTIPKIKIQPTGSGENRSLELTLQINTYTLKK